MTEFKQIVGRGTRLFEGKDFFTIIDFTGATDLFYDARWDGAAEAVQTTKVDETGQRIGDETQETTNDDQTEAGTDDRDADDEKPRQTLIIQLADRRQLRIKSIETTYVGEDGRPLSTAKYLEYLIGRLGSFYDDEAQLRAIWANPASRKELLNKLREMNIDEAQLEDLKLLFDAPDSDIYDVLAHLSFNHHIKTRSERVLAVEHGDFLARFQSQKAVAFLEFVLRRYEKDGVKELAEDRLGELIELSGLGKPKELGDAFGGLPKMREGYLGLQERIYE